MRFIMRQTTLTRSVLLFSFSVPILKALECDSIVQSDTVSYRDNAVVNARDNLIEAINHHELWKLSNCVVLHLNYERSSSLESILEAFHRLRRVERKFVRLNISDGGESANLTRIILTKKWSFEVDFGVRKCPWAESFVDRAVSCHLIPFWSQRRVKVGAFPIFPWIYMNPSRTGADQAILKILAEKYRFSYDLSYFPTHDAVIEGLKRGTFDLGIGQFGFTRSRHSVSAFSHGMAPIDVHFIHTHPEPVINYWTLFYPFQTPTWAFTFASAVVICLSLWALQSLRRKRNLFNTAQMTLSAVREPVPRSCLKTATKLENSVFGMWLICGFILSSAYSSTLLANLITIQYDKPIDTAQDVLNSGIPIVVPKGTLFEHSILTHINPHIQRIISEGFYIGVDIRRAAEWNEQIASGEVIRVLDPKWIYGYEDTFRLSKQIISSHFTGWTFTKASPLARLLVIDLQRIFEAGMVQKLANDNYFKDRKPKIAPKDKIAEKNKPLNVEHFLPMTFVLAFGLIPSAASFVIEYLK